MKTTLAGVLIVILVFVTNFSTIHTNRLKSDSIHFKANIETLETSKERSEMYANAQEDHYMSDHGYTSSTGKYTIENKKEEYGTGLSFDLIHQFIGVGDNLYLTTDKNDYYFGELPKSSWIRNDGIVEWDGSSQVITFNLEDGEDENNTKFKTLPFNISLGYVDKFNDIYKIDYYKDIQNNEKLYDDGQPHIILKLKNNSVHGYTIVNPVIEEFDFANIYDTYGNELFQFERNYVQEEIMVQLDHIEESNPMYETIYAVGHLMRFHHSNMTTFSITNDNPLLTTVETSNYFEEFHADEYEEVTYSLDSEMDFSIEIIVYEEGEDDRDIYKLESVETNMGYIIKQ